MSPWKVILATLVIFCSGLVTGTLLVRKVPPVETDLPTPSRATAGTNATPPWRQQQREQQKDFLKRIDSQLNLTPEQREKVAKIMKASEDRTKLIRDKIAPELKEELKKVREEIRLELTPEQKKKFDASIKSKPKKGEEEHHHHRQMTNAVPAPASSGETNH